jgi:hypothetical protein
LVFIAPLAWNSIYDMFQSCLVYFYSITRTSNPRYSHQNHHSRSNRTKVMRHNARKKRNWQPSLIFGIPEYLKHQCFNSSCLHTQY